jgi:hypothetical protein
MAISGPRINNTTRAAAKTFTTYCLISIYSPYVGGFFLPIQLAFPGGLFISREGRRRVEGNSAALNSPSLPSSWRVRQAGRRS